LVSGSAIIPAQESRKFKTANRKFIYINLFIFMKKLLRKAYFKTLDFFKSIISDKKKAAIILGALVVLVVGVSFGWKYLKPQPKKVYEALIAVRSQSNADPVEDAKNSLKAGDVILVLPEGHRWSDTEKFSYLLLKMNLTEKEAQTLVSPEEKKAVIPKPKTDEEKKQQAERKKAEGDRQQMETVRARRYRIKLEELDKNFDPNVLLNGQPYLDKIYDWKIVEKKPKL